MDDLLSYKEVYELRIPEDFEGKMVRTEAELKCLAEGLFQSDKRNFTCPPGDETLIENTMVVLPIPTDGADFHRAKELLRTKSPETNIEDILGDMVVVTSLSLLWNTCECEKIDWNAVIYADGTHDVFNSKDTKCIPIGANSCGFHAQGNFSRSGRPFGFILGPGEREEIVLLGLSAIKQGVKRLFGISLDEKIRHGVADGGPGIRNALLWAFPPVKILGNCYQHLHRKFGQKLPGRNNGQYRSFLGDNFTDAVAMKDINDMQRSRTTEQFWKMSAMVTEGWLEDDAKSASYFNPELQAWPKKEGKDGGPAAVNRMMLKSYRNPTKGYHSWFINCYDEIGLVPWNQSAENFNGIVKGAVINFLDKQANATTFYNVNLPNLVYFASVDRVGVQHRLAIEEVAKACNRAAIEYFTWYDDSRDCMNYSSNGKEGFLMSAFPSQHKSGEGLRTGSARRFRWLFQRSSSLS